MAKKDEIIEVDDVETNEDLYEPREIYPTGFRNIDTNIGARIYEKSTDKLLQVNRGIMSGSWITYTGVSHSGKSTLCLQHVASCMRKYVQEDNFDSRVKLHIFDVENGVSRSRFIQLTGFSNLQIVRHVEWEEDCTIEGLQDLINNVIKEKQEKSYKKIKRIGVQGYEVEMYPPTFIIVDAISELVSRDVIDVDNDATNTMYMRQNLMLDQFVKKTKLKFAKYNINIFTVAHIAKKIDVGGNPMAKPIKEWKGMPNDTKINGGKALQYATDIGFYIARIEASDSIAAERKGARILNASSIMEAKIFKNRQGLDNTSFYLVFDQKGMFDPLASFIYECQQFKVIESAGAVKKIKGTEFSCRSQDLIQKILTEPEFRTALFDKYDELKNDALESLHSTEEELQRQNDILDIMSL